MHERFSLRTAWRIAASMLFAAASLAPRRLLVIAALALGIGSVGQIRPAQAAPAGDASLRVYLHAEQVGGQRTLCVGDKVVIRVRVWQRVGVEGEFSLGRLIGVQVGAFVDGSGVGTISPASNATRLDSVPSGATFFTFTAEKPGTVTVVFRGTLNTRVILGLVLSSNTVTAAVPLKVDDCKYKVTTMSTWQDSGPAKFTVRARILYAGMAEVGGGLYRGTASVKWLITVGQVEDCIPQSASTTGQAELSGQVHGSEDMVVDLDFYPVTITLPVYCVGSSGEILNDSMLHELVVEPLQFGVHPAGGRLNRDAILQADGGSITAPIHIIVERAAGQ